MCVCAILYCCRAFFAVFHLQKTPHSIWLGEKQSERKRKKWMHTRTAVQCINLHADLEYESTWNYSFFYRLCLHCVIQFFFFFFNVWICSVHTIGWLYNLYWFEVVRVWPNLSIIIFCSELLRFSAALNKFMWILH